MTLFENPSQVLLISHFQALLNAGRLAEAHARADWLDADAARRTRIHQKTAARVARAQLLMAEGNFAAADEQLWQILENLVRNKAVPRLIARVGGVRVDCLIPLKRFPRAEAALLRTEEEMHTPFFREADRRRIRLQLAALYEGVGQARRRRTLESTPHSGAPMTNSFPIGRH